MLRQGTRCDCTATSRACDAVLLQAPLHYLPVPDIHHFTRHVRCVSVSALLHNRLACYASVHAARTRRAARQQRRPSLPACFLASLLSLHQARILKKMMC